MPVFDSLPGSMTMPAIDSWVGLQYQVLNPFYSVKLKFN